MDNHPFGTLLGLGIPAGAILLGSVVLVAKTKAVSAFLQMLGAAGLITVVLAHIAEAFGLLPWMQWGLEQSAGHYLDLCAAVVGLTLFPAGYLLDALTRRSA
jgi:hypothetical protein